MSVGTDTRSTTEVLTQWRKLEEIRRSLVRNGMINGDATPEEIIDALRRQIPADLFDDEK